MPATLSTITSTFAAEQKARAVGAWAGVAGASAILGLLTSGVLLEVWSWRAVFGLNVVLAVLAIIGTFRFIPESADPDAPRLDVVGALITVAGLGVLVYSIIGAPTAGWGSARTIGGIAAALVVLAGFVGWERTQRNPLLDPRLFGHRAFAAGTLSITLQFFGFFGFLFLVLQYLQLVRADSPLVAALSLIPMALAMMPSARIVAPRLVARVGQRRACSAGLALVAAGFLVVAQLDQTSSYWLLLAGLLPLGAGMGLAMTPATAAITDALPVAKQGVGSAMNDLSRELGGALGIAALGGVMQSIYRGHLDVSQLPPPLADHARSSLALASRLDPSVAAQARGAFIDGMQLAASMLRAAEMTGAVLVTMSNLYGYGPVDHALTEADPLRATGPKGTVRAAIWTQALAAHQAGRVRATEARAPDYFGPGVRQQSHLGARAIPRLLKGRPVRVFGDPDAPHSWTYVPDIAAALATLGTDQRAWGRAWHVPTNPPMSQREVFTALARLAGLPTPIVRTLPAWQLRAARMVVPFVREMDEIRYQFDRPLTFGAPPTPMDDALAATVRSWIDQARTAA